MKAKLKFDQAQLKTFLILHVEKIVFGGFVVALLLIAWSALKMKPYDKTPQELQAVADQISKKVEEQQPPEKFEKLAHVPDFTGLGAAGPAVVQARPYAIEPLERPYQEHDVRRAMPTFLPVKELLAYSGYGPIAIGEPNSVSRVAGGMAGDMGGDMTGGDMMGGMMGDNYSPPDMMESMQQRMQGMGGRRPGAGGPPEGMPGMMGGAGMMAGRGMGGAQGGGAAKRNRKAEQEREKEEKKKKADELRRAEEAAALAARKKAAGEHVLTSVPGNAHLDGRYWVCLVGAIPYAAQVQEFRKTFRDSTYPDKSRDFPSYVRPDIERAEVVAGEEPKWESVNVEKAWEDMRTWAAEYPDVVPFEFVEAIAEPLPALIGADFEPAEVVHPKVAELADRKAAEAEQAALEKEEQSKAKGPKGRGTAQKPGAGAGRGMPGGMGGGYGPMGGMAGRMRGGRPGGPMGGMGMGMGGAGMGGYGRSGYGMAGAGMGGAGVGGYGMMGGGLAGLPGASRQPERQPEWKLFRFFDFEAKPGKTYQYRVKLVFENPNFNVPIRYLENYADRDGEYREAEWSEPSPPVTVRHGNRMLAGPLKEVGGEPTIELAVKQFNQDEASEARKFMTGRRGAVLNELGAKVLVPDPTAQKGIGREVEVDFQTDTLLIDILGGDSISVGRGPKVKSPGHVLVLRSDGQFAVLDEAIDSQTFEMEKAEQKELKSPEDETTADDNFGATFSFGLPTEEKPKKKR
ncbi:MAG TPA: hypothetical protein VF306_21935 [Pirellulales bacterium]